jgi:hypothetical protein
VQRAQVLLLSGKIGVGSIPNVALAAVLAFTPEAIYPFYTHLLNRPGGISALQDQQIAAGIM